MIKNLSGSLVYEDYIKLFKNNGIISESFSISQIQPSSVDLSLSDECYEIKASFLSPNKNIRDNLEELQIQKINLSKKFLFKKNKIYLVKLNEKLNLPANVRGLCNPKSSTGRLDIFCRIILDKNDEYEKIPLNFSGEMFIEITSRSFNIEFQKNDSLNQMRLVFNNRINVNDEDLNTFHNENFLTLDKNNNKILPNLKNGLKISVDLSNENSINAYVAKQNSPNLYFNKFRFHKITDYWEPVTQKNNKLIIQKNNFYILKSKEKIQIPDNMAGEMIPYDTGIGDFRVHYAGFFDPGFGKNKGSYAVLEVKTSEVPFQLEDSQSIARIKFEMLNKYSKVIYGSNINSNYQHQGLALSKHFV